MLSYKTAPVKILSSPGLIDKKETTSYAGGQKGFSYRKKNLQLLECRGFADRYKNKRRIKMDYN
ncbi:MAG: hypothetical protein MRZ54_12335, partial [Clostridiales bacterium]|nr:hypothetical protein [Clostridiales bacterium]